MPRMYRTRPARGEKEQDRMFKTIFSYTARWRSSWAVSKQNKKNKTSKQNHRAVAMAQALGVLVALTAEWSLVPSTQQAEKQPQLQTI